MEKLIIVLPYFITVLVLVIVYGTLLSSGHLRLLRPLSSHVSPFVFVDSDVVPCPRLPFYGDSLCNPFFNCIEEQGEVNG